jgi:hypothetical protein
MATYWFKPRRFGYGATPVTWQGWVLVLVCLAIVAGCVAILEFSGHSLGGCVAAAVIFVVAIAVAVRWSWLKTEGEWRWRWGAD